MEITSRFPQLEDSVNSQFSYTFDKLFQCTKILGKVPGELYNPQGVAIHPSTNYIYIAEGGISSDFARISIFFRFGKIS